VNYKLYLLRLALLDESRRYQYLRSGSGASFATGITCPPLEAPPPPEPSEVTGASSSVLAVRMKSAKAGGNLCGNDFSRVQELRNEFDLKP
jgi:hypothetical protein